MRRLSVGDVVRLEDEGWREDIVPPGSGPHLFRSSLRLGDVGVITKVLSTGGGAVVRVRFWREPSNTPLMHSSRLELVADPGSRS